MSPVNLYHQSLRVILKINIDSVFDYNYHYPELPVELSGPGKQEEMKLYVLMQVQQLYGPKIDKSFVDTPKVEVPERLLPPKDIIGMLPVHIHIPPHKT